MAHIGRFCIDRYEAHLVTTGDDDEVLIHPHYERPAEDVSYEARSRPDVFPQAYISRVESQQACKNAGKRLCRWLEWRRACQGPRWRRYPYGYGAKKGHCNIGKPHLMPELFGANNRAWKYEEHFNSPKQNQIPGYLAKAGEHPNCVSADGVFDMSGNLHEWIATSVGRAFIKRMKKEKVKRDKQPYVLGNGVFMGGFYSTIREHGPGCYFTTIAHEPRYHDYSTGFRCCATAKRKAKPKKKLRPNKKVRRRGKPQSRKRAR